MPSRAKAPAGAFAASRTMHFQRTRATSTDIAGFTLVELVVVIMIIGILGAIALPRFFDSRVFAERGYYEELVAAIKFAHKAAVTSGCPVRVVLLPGSYQANQQAPSGGRCDPSDASWAMPVMLADGQALAGTAPTGVAAAPGLTWVFDALGRTNLGADQAISVGPYTMTLQAASGYVDTP